MENTKRALFIGFFILLALQNKGQDFIATEIPNINQLPTKEILCVFQPSNESLPIWMKVHGLYTIV